MNFLGRKSNGNFQGEVVSDLSSLVCRRVGGSRIKHRVKQNWLKMVDKAGLVLRVETVINNPSELQRAQASLAESRLGQAAHRVGASAFGRAVSVALPRGLAAGQRP
jgi:hypothetical protein